MANWAQNTNQLTNHDSDGGDEVESDDGEFGDCGIDL